MKRPYLSLLAMTLGIALMTGLSAWGQPKQSPQPAVCPAVYCPAPVCMPAQPPRCCAPSSPDNAKLVEELLAILKETQSTDAFLVTVKALSDVGPDAKTAVPAIIRGADRLGLLKDIEKQAKDEEGSGIMIVDAIEEILRGPCVAGAYAPSAVVGVPAPMYAPPMPHAAPCCPPSSPVNVTAPARAADAPKPTSSLPTPPGDEEKR
jgi:hypothetical protein